ncbi:hypothetical protein K1719_002007 [Acacia pycnantha]|nr:hypothetical protein K1719_002007 [Acacia pycnantha]
MASSVKRLLIEDDEFFLPHEIISSILKRLPVKSLLRFRCVCKDWNDLFKTSLFIKEHLHHSSHHRGPSLLLQWDYSTFSMLDSDKKTLLPLSAPSVNQPAHMIDIIGSSYGLVCLEITVREVEVYSLSTGSWKQIEFGNLLEGVSLINGRFAATDEAIYWFSYLNHIDILSFDIATEAITLIPIPDGPNIRWNIKLFAYENRLALLSGIELWVMEEATSGGSGQRWNKTKLIPNLRSLHPMTIWKNEAIYMFEQIVRIYNYLERVEVEVYSLSTGSWKQLEFGNLLEGVSLYGRFAATDEAIYWFAYCNHIDILSFDIATEAFTLIPIPAGPNIHWNIKLIAYENKLALLSGIELWVMEEATSGGSGQRWNKTKLIPNLRSLHLMTIWKNEAIYKFQQVGIYLFNLTTNKLKEFLIARENGNQNFPPPKGKQIEESTVDFLIQQAKTNPGKVTVVALGPLTNIALAIQQDPDFSKNIDQIVLLGGAFAVNGNVNPASEANIFGDPDVADVVFTSGADIVAIGINVTHQVVLIGTLFGKIQFIQFCYDYANIYLYLYL